MDLRSIFFANAPPEQTAAQDVVAIRERHVLRVESELEQSLVALLVQNESSALEKLYSSRSEAVLLPAPRCHIDDS